MTPGSIDSEQQDDLICSIEGSTKSVCGWGFRECLKTPFFPPGWGVAPGGIHGVPLPGPVQRLLGGAPRSGHGPAGDCASARPGGRKVLPHDEGTGRCPPKLSLNTPTRRRNLPSDLKGSAMCTRPTINACAADGGRQPAVPRGPVPAAALRPSPRQVWRLCFGPGTPVRRVKE